MALRRVKGAYSNPRAMVTALNMARKKAPREEIIARLQKRHFPKYTVEEVSAAFSPKGGHSKRIVDEVVRYGIDGELVPKTKKEAMRSIILHQASMRANVDKRRTNPTLDAQRRAKVSAALKEKHKDPDYKRRLNEGTQTFWKEFGDTPKMRKKRKLDGELLRARNADPNFALKRHLGQLKLFSKTKLKRVKGAYSNPRALITAVNLASQGKSRAEIFSTVQKKYFPKYSIDEVIKAFSPTFGITLNITKKLELLRQLGEQGTVSKEKRRQTIREINELSKQLRANIVKQNANPDFRARIEANSSLAMKELHKDPKYRRAFLKGLWEHVVTKFGYPKAEPIRVRLQKEAKAPKPPKAGVPDWPNQLAFESEKDAGGNEFSRVISATHETPASKFLSHERESVLNHALSAELTPREQTLVKMRFGFFGDVSNEQIARELGITELEVGAMTATALIKVGQNKQLRQLILGK